MKKIPELPRKINSGKLNSAERYRVWLELLRKYEKEDEVTVCSSKEELADFLGEFGTNEIFVVDFRACVSGRKSNYGIHFYFEPFDKATAVLIQYDEKKVEEIFLNIKGTPLSRFELYSTDAQKISLCSTWEYTYDLLVMCIDYFSKLK